MIFDIYFLHCDVSRTVCAKAISLIPFSQITNGDRVESNNHLQSILFKFIELQTRAVYGDSTGFH